MKFITYLIFISLRKLVENKQNLSSLNHGPVSFLGDLFFPFLSDFSLAVFDLVTDLSLALETDF